MSVYIPGMEMPTNCDECWTKYRGFGVVEHDEEWGTFYCKLAKGFCSDIRTKCPLIPVPEHGRLIDADVFFRDFPELIPYEFAAPTIIPADKEEEG